MLLIQPPALIEYTKLSYNMVLLANLAATDGFRMWVSCKSLAQYCPGRSSLTTRLGVFA